MPSQFLRRTLLPAALLAVALAFPRFAPAATLTVTDLGDSGAPGQLRTLINAAAPGDTIVIPAGTIALTGPAGEDANATGDIDIHKDLTIQGAGADSTIIDGGGGDRVIDIFAPATVTISNMTIRNGGFGSQGGGGIRNAGTLSLINVTVSNNIGGSDFPSFGLQNMTGGGVLNTGTMSLTNCTISGNATTFGGGGGIANTGTMTLTGVTLNGNTANDDQGGGGGGIANTGTLTLTNVSVSDNSALSGGGIFNGGTFETLTDCCIVVTGVGGTLSLTNATVSNNVGAVGAGIFNFAGSTVTLTGVTVAGNTADSGGGIVNAVDSAANLTNVTVSGNRAQGTFFALGGGISNAGTLSLTNVTISGNSADSGGGGIVNLVITVGDTFGSRTDFAGAATLVNVTISGNTGGGILGLDESSIGGANSSAQLKNTIVAGSPSEANCSGSPGTITSFGHNLDSGSTCGFTGPGDLSNNDPKLGPLQINGGLTQTHSLLPGSPAIDAGDNNGCPAIDQRGFARPQGAACDIGAYEFGAVDPASAFVTRLYEQVLNRQPDPAGLQAFIDQIAQIGSVVPTVFAFFHSQEFLGRDRTDEQFLTICYHTFLNREPDSGGFNAFLTALQSGQLTRDNLLDIFLDSQEFASLASFLPPLDPVTAFVTTLYVRILGRGPDQAGLQFFVAELQRTRTVLSTILSFLHSPEFLGRNTSNTEYVTVLYRVFLNRVPDAAGLTAFVNMLNQGAVTQDQLVAQFAASAEFQAIQHHLFP